MSNQESNITDKINLYKAVDTCPCCGSKIVPICHAHHAEHFEEFSTYYVICECPNKNCSSVFFVEYNGERILTEMTKYGSKYNFIIQEVNFFPYIFPDNYFEKEMYTVSPEFTDIYKQAATAEKMGLTKICGAGFRLSFEVLIKDFASFLFPDKEQEIKTDTKVSNIISNRIPNDPIFDEIKEISKRAWWLGCDTTHYEKKYKEQDLEDLKNCINITAASISFYLKRKHYNELIQPIKN